MDASSNVQIEVKVATPSYVNGDHLFAHISVVNLTAGSYPRIAAPAGWIEAGNWSAGTLDVRVYHKIAANEPVTHVWTLTGPPGNNGNGTIAAYGGASQNSALDATGSMFNSGGTVAYAPGITVTDPNAALMFFNFCTTKPLMTPPGAFTQRIDSVEMGLPGAGSLFLADRIPSGAGATGTVGAVSSLAGDHYAILVALASVTIVSSTGGGALQFCDF